MALKEKGRTMGIRMHLLLRMQVNREGKQKQIVPHGGFYLEPPNSGK